MQVNMHGIDRVEVRDYTGPKERTANTPPFVALRLYDGQGSLFTLFLRDAEDAVKLAESAREVLDILGSLEAVQAS